MLYDNYDQPVILRPPTDILATSQQGTILLTWTNPRDLDYHFTQIFGSRVCDRNTAWYLGNAFHGWFQHVGLSPQETWFYWLRSRYRGDVVSDEVMVSHTLCK
jgi:predicted phage tail protein